METKKHIQFFKRHLDSLPSAYTSYDSSHTALVFFCIGGLKLLGSLNDISGEQRQNWIEWIYLHMVDESGFRGSLSHCLDHPGSMFDPPNLSSTYFCLASLCLLEDSDISNRIDRRRFLEYLKRCQREDGGFNGVYSQSIGSFGDGDARYLYVASAICRILGFNNSDDKIFDIDKSFLFIKSTQAYDGGLSDQPGSESHSGLIYCSIAALALCGRLDPSDWDATARWLGHRQLDLLLMDTGYWDCEDVGGVNGRCNKPADTCYSFWTGASLKLLGHYDFIDAEVQKNFLFNCMQSPLLGGFVKSKHEYPDPLHSYLGLAALSLDGDSFDAALCLPKTTVDFIDSILWSV